ncbi:MAG: tetratricopeptide repeat protein [Candidatus Omnitrophota bacterium]|jgi:tetratricopeptide (TPR) repeat protein
MSNVFWKRLNIICGLFALGFIFGLLIFVANLEIKDLDLWLHLGMGRHLLENGFRVPASDILSCTFAGAPWVNHEWLFQVIVYSIFSRWGVDGLITMQVIIVTLTMTILLLMGYSKKRQLGSIFMLLLVSLVYENRFTIRPDLYSLLFFAFYIFILSFFIDKKWSLYVLFIAQVLWTNLHGFFFFGPLFVFIGLISEWMKRHLPLPYEWNKTGRLTDDEYSRMAWILGTVVLACLLNPLTFEGAWYPIGVFFKISGEHRVFFDKIIELQKPIEAESLFSPAVYPYYKLLLLLSFVSLFFNRFRLDIASLIFWLIFLFFSLAAVRNLIFFAFAAYIVFMSNAHMLTMRDIVPIRITDKKFFYLTSMLVKIFLIVWVMQYWSDISKNGYFDFDKYERKSEFGGISLRSYPIKAVDFLVENKVKGNFFNDFNAGAYMVGRCFPDIKVFIDGRTEVYGPEFFNYYVQLWEKDNPEIFAQALGKFNITGAILNSVQQPIPPRIINYLENSEEWIPVYFDYDGVIYLKDVPQNREIIEKYAIDFSSWEGKSLDLYRLGSKKVVPFQNMNRAYTLESLGYDKAAMREIECALKVTPVYKEPYKLLGKIFAKHKRYQEAFENFRIAVLFDHYDNDMRHNLAKAYYDLGEFKHAADQYQRIINQWPKDPKAHFLIARCLIKMEKYDTAMEFIRVAHELKPKNIKDILNLGEMLGAQKQHTWALEVYQMGLETGSKLEEVHHQMGLVYQTLGDEENTEIHFQEENKIIAENRLAAPDSQGSLPGAPSREEI